jgi:flagellar biosynthesis/type III secretory pathway protein FliH
VNDLAEMVKGATDTAMAAFKAGHDEGYRLGYREGYAAAIEKTKEILNTSFSAKPVQS